MFVKLGLQLVSDMSMRICTVAAIAENPLLCVRFIHSLLPNKFNLSMKFAIRKKAAGIATVNNAVRIIVFSKCATLIFRIRSFWEKFMLQLRATKNEAPYIIISNMLIIGLPTTTVFIWLIASISRVIRNPIRNNFMNLGKLVRQIFLDKPTMLWAVKKRKMSQSRIIKKESGSINSLYFKNCYRIVKLGQFPLNETDIL